MRRWELIAIALGLAAAVVIGVVRPWDPAVGERRQSEWVADLSSKDSAAREKAAEALAQSGSEGIPHLIRAMDDPKARSQVARALGRLGPAAREAVPALERAVREHNASIEVVKALGNISPGVAGAIPALEMALHPQRSTEVHREAVLALSAMGPEGVSALLRCLGRPEAHIRGVAIEAAAKLGPAGRPVLLTAIEGPHEGDRSLAVRVASERGDVFMRG